MIENPAHDVSIAGTHATLDIVQQWIPSSVRLILMHDLYQVFQAALAAYDRHKTPQIAPSTN